MLEEELAREVYGYYKYNRADRAWQRSIFIDLLSDFNLQIVPVSWYHYLEALGYQAGAS